MESSSISLQMDGLGPKNRFPSRLQESIRSRCDIDELFTDFAPNVPRQQRFYSGRSGSLSPHCPLPSNFCRICNAAEFLGLNDFTATRSIAFQELADLLETHEAIAPPSTSIIVPVTNSFSSRKIAAAATSSAVPARGIICPDVPF